MAARSEDITLDPELPKYQEIMEPPTQAMVTFTVGGQTFTISRESIDAGPPSKLKQLCYQYAQNNMVTNHMANHVTQYQPIAVDRPPELFGAILGMYQTRELHIPATACPGTFLNELYFWELDVNHLSDCCFTKLKSFLDEQQILRDFQSFQDTRNDHRQSKWSLRSLPVVGPVRQALWEIMDGNIKTPLAKLYFIISLVVVLLSIFAIAYGTDAMFQRQMTNCERLEYMVSSGMEHVEHVEEPLLENCENSSIPAMGSDSQQVWSSGRSYDDYDSFIEVYVTIPPPNTTDSSTLSNLRNQSPTGVFILLPNMNVKIYTLVVFDVITVIFFTADLIVRLFCCPCVIRYFTSVINVADVAALVATYIHIVCLFFFKHHRYEDKWIDILEYMQMLRALRLFRIVSNVRAGRVLAYTIRSNAKDLLILIMFLIAGMCVFASLFYIAEPRMESIPSGWYWAIVTMTTVGYGDITPTTNIGRAISCICAVSGVLLFAMTVPIFANHFMTLYQCVGSEQAVRKELIRRSAIYNQKVRLGMHGQPGQYGGNGMQNVKVSQPSAPFI